MQIMNYLFKFEDGIVPCVSPLCSIGKDRLKIILGNFFFKTELAIANHIVRYRWSSQNPPSPLPPADSLFFCFVLFFIRG